MPGKSAQIRQIVEFAAFLARSSAVKTATVAVFERMNQDGQLHAKGVYQV
jgi:hypothetical protein